MNDELLDFTFDKWNRESEARVNILRKMLEIEKLDFSIEHKEDRTVLIKVNKISRARMGDIHKNIIDEIMPGGGTVRYKLSEDAKHE